MKKQHLAIVLLLNLGLFFSAKSQNPLPEFAHLKKIEQLSSKNEESMPFPYLNGKKMYFVRTIIAGSMRQRVTGQDIWSSEFNETSWNEPSNLFEEANDNGNNAVVGVSNDGNTLYLFNSVQTRRKMAKGIAVTKKDAEGNWSDLEKVDVPGFKIGQGLYSLYMTPNEKILLIGMSPSDTSAQSDLFVSLKDAEGNWSELRDLGSIINTGGTEITPFIDQNGTTLYFSSDGHKGLGGMDIFTSYRLDDSWSNWSEPLNLGAPINSDAFDAYFMFSNEKEALFTSNRDGKFSDIYSTKIKEEPIIVKAEERVFGQVFFEAMPLEDLDLLILDVEGNLVDKEKTDEEGRFSYVKSDNQAYNIQLEEENTELQKSTKIYIIDKNGKKLERLSLNSIGSYASISENIDSEMIDGLLEYNNLPLQNILLIVYDESNFIVDTLVTDENGKFSYKKLKGDNNFTIRPIITADDDLIDNMELFATNKKKKKMSNLIVNTNQIQEEEVIAELQKNTKIYIIDKDRKKLEKLTVDSTGSYTNVVESAESELVEGLFEYNNLPQQNTRLIVYDENNFPVDTLVTDENGKFSYKKLKGDNNFTIRPIMTADDDLIDNMEIFATNKSGEKLSKLIINTKQVEEEEQIAAVIKEKAETIVNTPNPKSNQQVTAKSKKDKLAKKEPNLESNGKTIYFNFNERVLTPDDKVTLDKIINSLKSNPESRVTMIGFTDNIGSKETNVKVASARARASRAYLIENNISKSKIDIYGYGEVMFKGDNSTKEGRALNRRVEIKIN